MGWLLETPCCLVTVSSDLAPRGSALVTKTPSRVFSSGGSLLQAAAVIATPSHTARKALKLTTCSYHRSEAAA